MLSGAGDKVVDKTRPARRSGHPEESPSATERDPQPVPAGMPGSDMPKTHRHANGARISKKRPVCWLVVLGLLT